MNQSPQKYNEESSQYYILTIFPMSNKLQYGVTHVHNLLQYFNIIFILFIYFISLREFHFVVPCLNLKHGRNIWATRFHIYVYTKTYLFP